MEELHYKKIIRELPQQLTAMPMKNNTIGSWCSCFTRSQEPPEITLTVVENGIVSLQPVTPTIPMPDIDEIETKFSELVDELDLAGSRRDAMFNLPATKKWQIYCSKKMELEDSDKNNPFFYIEKVNTMSSEFSEAEDNIGISSWFQQMESVRTALRTKSNSFVTGFLEADGLSCLLTFLDNMNYKIAQSNVHTSVIGCFKALMNNSSGREYVLSHPNTIGIIAQSLASDNLRTKVAALEILGAVCLVHSGHKTVLNAMIHFQKYAGERTRFQSVVNDLNKLVGDYHEEVNLKTAIMSFINAVLNYGAGQYQLEFRIHLRYELLMLGIIQAMEKLRKYENETLNRHVDFFDMVRSADEKEIAKRFDMLHIDTKSARGMFDVLQRKILHTTAYPHFLSLLEHCLLIPWNSGAFPQYWLLFDRLLQQIVLQTENGDPDGTVIDINVQEIVQLLATEEEQRLTKEKADRFENESNELVTKLTTVESELERKTTENDDKQRLIKRLHNKLNHEQANHLDSKKKLFELECKVTELQVLIECEKSKRRQQAIDNNVGNLHVTNGINGVDEEYAAKSEKKSSTRLTLTNGSIIKDTQCVLPPPPPPPPPLGGPPPPPPSMSVAKQLTPRIRGDIPKPSNPLKAFNWSKLTESRVDGTVWSELEDTKLYRDLDLSEIDKAFSAFQKQTEGSTEDLRMISRTTKNKELSVIDGRRAQNLTILLSKLKLSDREICDCLYSMDRRDQLPKDMIEQLLKFMPSSEEKNLLEENRSAIDQMAKADRFLYELSRIIHYEERVKTLYYKKKFNERINECKPKIEGLRRASKEVKQSRKLKKLLEIVLAIGNYMNRGQRGNAYGFKLSSLNRLVDTKSSTNRSMTLLHHIINIISIKFKDLLRLGDEISSVRMACKVNMTELTNEINSLKRGMQEIKKELEYNHAHPNTTVKTDQFVPVVEEFVVSASFECSGLVDLYNDMKTKYDEVTVMYAEDSNQVNTEEFFGGLNTFLNSFAEAISENETFRKSTEEQMKIKMESEKNNETSKETNRVFSKMEVRKATINGRNEKTNGEFDDLISALRTGDVFGDDLAKIRKVGRRRSSQPVNNVRNPPSPSPVRTDSVKSESTRERIARKY